MQVTVCLEPNRKKYKEFIFVITLWFQVMGSFILSVYLGFVLDNYFNTKPICLFLFLLMAFIYVIKTLLGVGKNG